MLAASLILLAIGLALCVRGMVGRRVGDEPRCRKCKYELTNLTSDRCPECGVTLGPRAVQTGLRRWRLKFLAIGACAVIIAGAWLAPIGLAKVRAVNWYHALPSTWVYSSAVGGSPRAVAVLADRYERARLDKSLIGRIADTALARQASPTMRFSDPWLDALLGPMYVNGDLNAAQIDLFYSQILGTPSLTVRSKIRTGDTLPMELSVPIHAPRGLPILLGFSLTGANALTNNFPGYRTTTGLSGGLYAFPCRIPVVFDSISPGHHIAKFTLYAELAVGANRTIDSRFPGGPAADVVATMSAPIETEFDVVRSNATDPLKIQRGPDVDRLLAQALKPSVLLWNSNDSFKRLSVMLHPTKPLPTAGIVRIFVRDKSGRDIQCNTQDLRGRGSSGTDADFGLQPGDRTTVRIRGDLELARASLDIFDAWEGEIIFDDVPVEAAPKFAIPIERNLLTPGGKLPAPNSRPMSTQQSRFFRQNTRSKTRSSTQSELTPVTDPQIEDALRRAISFGIVKTIPADASQFARIQIDMSTTSMPCDVAFDLCLRCGSHEQQGGPLVLPEAASMPANRFEMPLDPGCRDGDEVTIVLRPNTERAKLFGDRMTEYWANELDFGPYRLTRAKSDDTTQVWRFPSED